MKKLYIIYIALLFIFGCKSNDKKFDNIEIMVYNYKWDKLDQSENKDKPYIKSYMYVLIDENINSKIILQNYSTNDKIKYISFDIDKNIKSQGNGIYNMRERVNVIGGSIEIISRLGEGTTINIKIPLIT